MAIIGISGYAGSGKDTVGRIIQYLQCKNVGGFSFEDILKDIEKHDWWLAEQSGWEIKRWGGKLKQIASILTGIPAEKFEDQEFKKTDLGKEWSYPYPGEYWDNGSPIMVAMSVRDFLQKLGTDALRDSLHPNTWINALMSEYKVGPFYPDVVIEKHAMHPNWIITDTRFPNEAESIKERNGIIIRVDRPGVKPTNDHPSETSLDSWKFDYKIMNGSDLVSLSYTVLNILRKENIL